MPGHRFDDDENVITQSESKDELKEPSLYKVLLHNDNYTTMDFVIFVLITVFQRSVEDAQRLTLQVHTQGVAIGGIYPHEIAETKAAKVIQLARECEFPFLCTVEEA